MLLFLVTFTSNQRLLLITIHILTTTMLTTKRFTLMCKIITLFQMIYTLKNFKVTKTVFAFTNILNILLTTTIKCTRRQVVPGALVHNRDRFISKIYIRLYFAKKFHSENKWHITLQHVKHAYVVISTKYYTKLNLAMCNYNFAIC